MTKGMARAGFVLWSLAAFCLDAGQSNADLKQLYEARQWFELCTDRTGINRDLANVEQVALPAAP